MLGRRVDGKAVLGRDALQVLHQLAYVDHDIAAVESGGELGVEDASGAQLVALLEQIIYDGKVVVLDLGLVYGEGIGHTDGSVATGQHVGR